MESFLLTHMALIIVSLTVILLWFWQRQEVSEIGVRAGMPAVVLSLWLMASETFGPFFFVVRPPGLPDLSIERALFLVVLFFLVGGLFIGRVSLRKNNSIEIVMGIFLLILFVSMVRTGFSSTMPDMPAPSFIFLTGYLIPFICFVMAKHYLVSEKDVSFFLHVLFYFGIYLCVTSFFEYADLQQFVFPRFISDPQISQLHLGRARGPFLNAAFNGVAILAGFVSGVHILQKKAGFAKVFHLGALLLFFPAVFFTLTRSVYLGLIVALFILLRWYKTPAGKWKRFAIPIALVLILAVVNSGRLTSDDRRAGGVAQMDEVNIRLNLMAKSFALFQDDPWLGIGLAQFIPAAAESLKPPPRPFSLEDVQSQFQHNHLLGIATELGLVGLVTYLTMLVLLFRRWKRLAGILPEEGIMGGNLRFIILIVWCVYLINNMLTEPSNHLFLNAAPFIFAGLADGIYTRSLAADVQGAKFSQPSLTAHPRKRFIVSHV